MHKIAVYILTFCVSALSVLLPMGAPRVFAAEDAPIAKTDADDGAKIAQTEEDKRVAAALKKWFEGDVEAAEAEFSAMAEAKTENPVPYHALAVMLGDRNADRVRATDLMNRHRYLLPYGQDCYLAVLPVLEEYALSGSVQAQLLLGRTLSYGGAGRYWSAKAMLMFRRAADGGYAPAQRELGSMYETGRGVTKDLRTAERLYAQAAAQGDAYAMTALAVLYINSAEGGAKSGDARSDRAVSLLDKAASMRSADAEIILAKMYQNGIYFKKDDGAAVGHYKKAAEYGSSEAMGIMGWIYEQGKFAEKSAELSLKNYRAAADCGNDNALFRLGALYYTGNMVKEDHAEAFRYFKRAAELGHVVAWFNVGLMYVNGDGTERDAEEAKVWFERSARAGNAEAQSNLGIMYSIGDGAKEDPEEAYFWFALSKLNGFDSSNELKSVAKKLDAAAIDRAQRRAKTMYSRMRKRGIGPDSDPEEVEMFDDDLYDEEEPDEE